MALAYADNHCYGEAHSRKRPGQQRRDFTGLGQDGLKQPVDLYQQPDFLDVPKEHQPVSSSAMGSAASAGTHFFASGAAAMLKSLRGSGPAKSKAPVVVGVTRSEDDLASLLSGSANDFSSASSSGQNTTSSSTSSRRSDSPCVTTTAGAAAGPAAASDSQPASVDAVAEVDEVLHGHNGSTTYAGSCSRRGSHAHATSASAGAPADSAAARRASTRRPNAVSIGGSGNVGGSGSGSGALSSLLESPNSVFASLSRRISAPAAGVAGGSTSSSLQSGGSTSSNSSSWQLFGSKPATSMLSPSAVSAPAAPAATATHLHRAQSAPLVAAPPPCKGAATLTSALSAVALGGGAKVAAAASAGLTKAGLVKARKEKKD
ncbi:hypothetical protein CHLRE_04g212450v5 [Chlamydomonas reinhardtii]|uniref:Uncharacterized protein n=1 Tax=Chlamydomonas reinhardtii TaxID=3055 RepID=A0A2K3DTY4_CHLRE|nr:uncharacterized protein CHLRE_04g212450v5 [Chlamydomonas reinhardtii]PNW83996.1 hypothetical protein CHLRE_04g212450v5 [Chlamydomonas reinhardtii]